ncbi:lebercilin-like isoform X2 [Mercenaria mercenaria]|uniref:lebercilin-like isoform X2 n=1 Tax=Mercenaria mercenaria TaxID=6596 RepID=UPI00234F5116|nr:lebercilin-like isoform X2 [Mercenaria mercenaria]
MTHRNHTRSPYGDDSILDDDYSDDFDDDDNDTGTKRYKTRSPLNRTASGHEVRRPKDSRSSDSKLYNRSNRGRGRGRGRFSQLGRNSHDTSRVDNITKRVLSARRLKINEIQNQNQELLLQLKDLKEENKLLKKTQHRADKALQKFEDRESELPQLIQRQNNEVRSLRDQIRKWREKYEKTDRYLRDAEDELEKAKIKLKKLKSLADEKDLPERAELNKKLNNAELDMEARDVKVKELKRHIQNLEKNHRHQLGIERARQKETQQQLAHLREENDKLSVAVKEKDKEIQIKNIYANRAAAKPPHRLPNSYSGTPNDTPPPRRRRPSLSEADKMTPRDRAKQMEEKRREELRRQRELKQQHDKIKREKELRKMREEEERQEEEQRERAETERREYEEREREMNAQAEREAEERRMREERERMKREAEERKQREREKQEREERERKMREKREKEERERRERERQEQERRAAEERRRFEDDVSIQAERKKKDEILQKLREIDEGGQKNDKKKDPFKSDPFFVTQNKEDSQDSMASSKKSYTFSKPIENLHNGKPSRKDGNSNLSFGVNKSQSTGVGRRRDVDSVETGGYNPTFGSKRSGANSTAATKTFSLFDDDDDLKTSSTAPKPAQKSKLMDELFGSKDNDGPKHNDLFSSNKPPAKKTNQSRSTLPWEDDGFGNRKQSGSTLKTKRENSATLFGGGSAFVNDEDLRKSQINSNTSVPRRQKQTTTFHTRPTVNAIDNFDDDIEEVIL